MQLVNDWLKIDVALVLQSAEGTPAVETCRMIAGAVARIAETSIISHIFLEGGGRSLVRTGLTREFPSCRENNRVFARNRALRGICHHHTDPVAVWRLATIAVAAAIGVPPQGFATFSAAGAAVTLPIMCAPRLGMIRSIAGVCGRACRDEVDGVADLMRCEPRHRDSGETALSQSKDSHCTSHS